MVVGEWKAALYGKVRLWAVYPAAAAPVCKTTCCASWGRLPRLWHSESAPSLPTWQKVSLSKVIFHSYSSHMLSFKDCYPLNCKSKSFGLFKPKLQTQKTYCTILFLRIFYYLHSSPSPTEHTVVRIPTQQSKASERKHWGKKSDNLHRRGAETLWGQERGWLWCCERKNSQEWPVKVKGLRSQVTSLSYGSPYMILQHRSWCARMFSEGGGVQTM